MNGNKFICKLLETMPHERGAEIGVFEGETTVLLMECLPDLLELWCIDPWKAYEDFENSTPNKQGRMAKAIRDDFASTYRTFEKATKEYRKRIKVVRAFSDTACNSVPNDYLDFVFIDGNHSYDYVFRDLRCWTPKVKVGGLISGHDYVNKKGYGVIEATEEFFPEDLFINMKHKVWWTFRKE